MIELHNCDCLQFMRTMPDKSVDAVITDPPYGMYKAKWDEGMIDPSLWVHKFNNVATFCGVKGIHDYPKSDWTMAWVRLGSTQRNGSYGGFNNWEPILIYGFKKIANDVIRVANFQKYKIDHPTPKPVQLMKLLITRLTSEGDTIFDPFMGSGTTGVACVQTGRSFIGCEIDEGYFKIAERRIAEAQLQMRLPI
jgi:site-specific DNA-methyltransferase (adenine-specific)